MFGDWKIQLMESPGMVGYQLYLYRVLPDRQREFLTKGGKEIETVKQGDPIADKDYTFCTLEHDQLLSIVEAFSSKGFKTTNDHKNEGLLQATEKHLEDMRTLVFKGVKR